VELEAAATEYVCREVARPESDAAAKAIDDALEALVTALAREEEIRQVTGAAIRVRGRRGSSERMGRYLRRLTLDAVGDGLAGVRHIVEEWRKEAYRGGYTACRKPRHIPRSPAERQAEHDRQERAARDREAKRGPRQGWQG
jgi:hypothetical protein